ncbi:MAG: VCBS repeat-containing protein [Geobacteraceae bacterium]|nr:VCBS repeat-containing protein [Geobacteraceae bacterium]
MGGFYVFRVLLACAALFSLGYANIVDAGTIPSLYGRDAYVLKGKTASVTAIFNITLSSPSNQTITVNYATANDTATAGVNYTAASGILSIPPNTRTATVSVTVFGNNTPGVDKQFFLDLSSPVNATLGTSRLTGHISDSTTSIAFSDPLNIQRYWFQSGDFVGTNLYPATGANRDMRLADFDMDGKLDLIIPASHSYDSHVWLFKGNGDGSFREPVSFSSTYNVQGPNSLAIGDLNNDGYPDYVVANGGILVTDGSVHISLNGGSPFFVVGGVGGFTTTAKVLGNYPTGVALADLDNDGDLDIAVSCNRQSGASSTAKVILLLNNGDETFADPIELDTGSSGAYGIAAADFRNLGWNDLIVTLENENKVLVFYNMRTAGSASFSAGTRYSVGSYPTGVAVGDLDGISIRI